MTKNTNTTECKTDICNLDRNRFQVVTNDKFIIKYLKLKKINTSGSLLKREISPLTKKPTDDYIFYHLYILDDKTLIDNLKLEAEKNKCNIDIKHIKEFRESKLKKENKDAN